MTVPVDSIPELGPSLGRLIDPPPAPLGALRVPLDDVRIDLVTGVFDLAGAARSFAAAGDHDGGMASLGRAALLALWEKAVATAAGRIAAEANAGLKSAAEEARYPKRRLTARRLTEQDARAIAARLGSGGAPFVASLDALEQAANGAGGARGREAAAMATWQAAVMSAARRLEAGWMALEDSARAEQARWAAEIEQVRRWRRPTWPIWAVSAVVVAAAGYLGLVLGGYLPVPPALEGLATMVWTRL
ncbi:MAG TPA: hypothetical protein VFN08_16315 [Gemmatimonadales bacterium]|jgi:hypothetical protein|nr:hypothetical protein [Gemmatimonadales bacterium]